MTYRLPFGLKQKPLPHYFKHGVIKFSMNEGTMHYEIKQITKEVNGTIYRGIVKDRPQLDQLLAVKSFIDVIRLLEIIN